MIDTHCHLYDKRTFPDPSLTVSEAQEAGVERLIVIGIDDVTNADAVSLADQFDCVYATVGWHPTNAAKFRPEHMAQIEELSQHPKVVAIGEIGFDFHWDFSTVEQQEIAFREQFDFAVDKAMPMVYHCREAYPHMLARLRELPEHQAVFHCFAGNSEEAKEVIGMGLFIGVDGPVTYPKAVELREIIAEVNRDRVVIETDAPYLSPQKFRGKPNHPAYVRFVLEKIAEIWEISDEECDRITTENARRLFPKLA